MINVYRPNRRLALCMKASLILLLLGGCGQKEKSDPKSTASHPAYTFAVVGDNRGDSAGNPAPVFVRIVEAMRKDAPKMVFNTGDLFNGYKGENEAHLRKLWQGYLDALKPLGCPVYNAPGNHDLFDAVSAKLWKEYQGPTYYTLDRENARFIILDSETQPSRLGEKQFSWLEGELEGAGNRHVFVILHRPLFPVDGHIGYCMDLYPRERDALHRLFVRHKDRIKGVFLGHEHMYYYENRDGVPYHTVAGGGAELYMPPELGGYYHYLLVRVEGDRVSTELKKVGIAPEPEPSAVSVAAGALLEGWENPSFWETWDHSIQKFFTSEQATHGRQGLKLRFDLSLYAWPVLMVPLAPARDLTSHAAVLVDVYVPPGQKGELSIKPVLIGTGEHSGPQQKLKPGWNTVRTALDGAWLPAGERKRIRQIQWVLESPATFAGWVAYDHLRLEGGPSAPPLESWEGRMRWGLWDQEETARQETDPQNRTQGGQGVRIRYDFRKSPYLVLYGTPAAPLNLEPVSQIAADVFAPPQTEGELLLSLRLGEDHRTYASPEQSLKPGWNRVTVDLNGAWLPEEAKDEVDQIQWVLKPRKIRSQGWITLDNLSVGDAKL